MAGYTLLSGNGIFEPWGTVRAAGSDGFCDDHGGGREKFLHLEEFILTFPRAIYHVSPLCHDWVISVRILSILSTNLFP